MRMRRLGRTNLQISELSFGAARGAARDEKRFIQTVHAAIAAGINFVDTAESYDKGESERVLGTALQGRPHVLVETKYRPYDSHRPDATYTGSADALVASVEASLRRLKRDRLDILLGHGIRTLESLDRFMNDGCYEAMVRLRDQGKVRFIGISELSEGDGTHEVLKRVVPTGAFDVVMLTLNMFLQTAAKNVLPLCRRSDVGTVVMMPLNQASKQSGLVSVDAARECVRRHIDAGNLPDDPVYTDPDLFDFLAPYSIPEAALRFVLSHDVSTCCVGMSSPERVEQNLQATIPLADAEGAGEVARSATADHDYLESAQLRTARTLFGGIQWQIR